MSSLKACPPECLLVAVERVSARNAVAREQWNNATGFPNPLHRANSGTPLLAEAKRVVVQKIATIRIFAGVMFLVIVLPATRWTTGSTLKSCSVARLRGGCVCTDSREPPNKACRGLPRKRPRSHGIGHRD
jgi:hypothetical protein